MSVVYASSLRDRLDGLGFHAVNNIVAAYLELLHGVLTFTPVRTAKLHQATENVRRANIGSSGSVRASAAVGVTAEVHQAQSDWLAAWQAASPFASVGVYSAFDMAFCLRSYAAGQKVVERPLWCDLEHVLSSYPRRQLKLANIDWEVLINSLSRLRVPPVALQHITSTDGSTLTLASAYGFRERQTYPAMRAPLQQAAGQPLGFCGAVINSVEYGQLHPLPEMLQPISIDLASRIVQHVRNELIGHDRREPLTVDAFRSAAELLLQVVVRLRVCVGRVQGALAEARLNSASVAAVDGPILDALRQQARDTFTLATHVEAQIHLSLDFAVLPMPLPDAWQNLLQHSADFRGKKMLHVLIAPPLVQSSGDDGATHHLQALARVPWTLVLDFCNESASPLYAALRDGGSVQGNARKLLSTTRSKQLALEIRAAANEDAPLVTWVVPAGCNMANEAPVQARARSQALSDIVRATLDLAASRQQTVHVTVLAYGDYGHGGVDGAYFVRRADGAEQVRDAEYPRLANYLLLVASDADDSMRVAIVYDLADSAKGLQSDVLMQGDKFDTLFKATTAFALPLPVLAAGLGYSCGTDPGETEDLCVSSEMGMLKLSLDHDLRAPAAQRDRWRSLGLHVVEARDLLPLEGTALQEQQDEFLIGAQASWRLLSTPEGVVMPTAGPKLSARVRRAVEDAKHAIGDAGRLQVVFLRHAACTGASTLARIVAARMASDRPVVAIERPSSHASFSAVQESVVQLLQIAEQTASTTLLLVDDTDASRLLHELRECLHRSRATFVVLQVRRISELFMLPVPFDSIDECGDPSFLTPVDTRRLLDWKEKCWVRMLSNRSGIAVGPLPPSISDSASASALLDVTSAIAAARGDATNVEGGSVDVLHTVGPTTLEDADVTLFFGINQMLAQGRPADLRDLWRRVNQHTARALFALRAAENSVGPTSLSARRLAHTLRLVAFAQVYARAPLPGALLRDFLSSCSTPPAAAVLRNVVLAALRRHAGSVMASDATYLDCEPVKTRTLVELLREQCGFFGIAFAGTSGGLMRETATGGVLFCHWFVAHVALFWLLRPHEPGDTLATITHLSQDMSMLALSNTVVPLTLLTLDLLLTWVCRASGKPVSLDSQDQMTRILSQLLYEYRVVTVNHVRTAFTPLVTFLQNACLGSPGDAASFLQDVAAASDPLFSDSVSRIPLLTEPVGLLLHIAKSRLESAAASVHLIRLLSRRISVPPTTDVPPPLLLLPSDSVTLAARRDEVDSWVACIKLTEDMLLKYETEATALDTAGNAWVRHAHWLLDRASELWAIDRFASVSSLHQHEGSTPASSGVIESSILSSSVAGSDGDSIVMATTFCNSLVHCYSNAVKLFRREAKSRPWSPYPYCNTVRAAVALLRGIAICPSPVEAAAASITLNAVADAFTALSSGLLLSGEADHAQLHRSRGDLVRTLRISGETALTAALQRVEGRLQSGRATLSDAEIALHLRLARLVPPGVGGSDGDGPDNAGLMGWIASQPDRTVLNAPGQLLFELLSSATDAPQESAMLTAMDFGPWLSFDAGHSPFLSTFKNAVLLWSLNSGSSAAKVAAVALTFSRLLSLLLHSFGNQARKSTELSACLAEYFGASTPADRDSTHVRRMNAQANAAPRLVIRQDSLFNPQASVVSATQPQLACLRRVTKHDPCADLLLVVGRLKDVVSEPGAAADKFEGNIFLADHFDELTIPARIDQRAVGLTSHHLRSGVHVVVWFAVTSSAKVVARIIRLAGSSDGEVPGTVVGAFPNTHFNSWPPRLQRPSTAAIALAAERDPPAAAYHAEDDCDANLDWHLVRRGTPGRAQPMPTSLTKPGVSDSSDDRLRILASMGFSDTASARALKHHRGDVSRAVEELIGAASMTGIDALAPHHGAAAIPAIASPIGATSAGFGIPSGLSDIAIKRQRLQKKLRAIEALERKVVSSELLNEDERAKLATRANVEKELSELDSVGG